MPILPSRFRPHPLLRNPHLQTILPQVVPTRPGPDMDWERIELPDGDFLDLCWSRHGRGATGPIVIVLHGLNGSMRSAYSRRLVRSFSGAGYRVLFMHFRGSSGEPNRLPRSYHSGDTGDLSHVLDLVAKRYPGTTLAAFGVSLGGNVLLKYLGETGRDSRLGAAAAASVPFDLANAATTLESGFAGIYHAYLLRGLIRSARRKYRQVKPPFPLPNLSEIKSIYEFDDRITAPLHGFDGADDYYARSSCRQFLAGIGIPTLIVHARDDPFMTPAGIPNEQELAPAVELELPRHGGHLGFVASGPGLRPESWLAERITGYLRSRLEGTAAE